jgi:exodeoxyribonuclease VII large subunit
LKVSQDAIARSSQQLIQNAHKNLINFEAIVRILSPENTLKRGYALVSAKGKIITDTKKLEIGESISIQTHQHELEATITSKKNRDERT